MLAFLGGTGPEGRGLALRLALAGEGAIIGSRDAGRAAAAAEELLQLAPGAHIEGAVNDQAADGADLVFLTFPYEGQRTVLEQLQEPLAGKIVVNVIAPMLFQRGRGASAVEVPAGSAAQEAPGAVAQLQGSRRVPERKRSGATGARQDHGGGCNRLLQPPGIQRTGDGPGKEDPFLAAGGWRRTGQRQVRGADYPHAGKYQPDLQHPRRDQNCRHSRRRLTTSRIAVVRLLGRAMAVR